MVSDTVIAAAIGLLGGGGAVKGFSRIFGAERAKTVVGYQLQWIETLQNENRELRQRIAVLEAAVYRITGGELPPEYS